MDTGKICIVAISAIAAAVAAAQNIVTADMVMLVRNHSSYQANKDLLTGMEKDYRKSLESMRDELEKIQEEGRKLSEELKNPMLSAAAKEKAEKDMSSVQQRYMALQQKMMNEAKQNQKTISDMEARLLKSQTDDLRKKVAEFAKEKGYDLVLDSSAALYAVAGLDVTDALLEYMGVDPKAARAKESDESK
ncbi:MAG: OmpH family outer membrane protein [Kiritimatiellae bacterium]|nr:OmpH family outer membrane protein [Kiritimatiellia bacterium]